SEVSGPSKCMLVRSIVRRKPTTARPEKMPMTTDTTRKKRSSCSTEPNKECNRCERLRMRAVFALSGMGSLFNSFVFCILFGSLPDNVRSRRPEARLWPEKQLDNTEED